MTTAAGLGEVDVVQVRGWGNHHRKFLDVLTRHHEALAAHADQLTLFGAPADAASEIRYLRRVAPDAGSASRMCGAYYAYHFLTLNQRTLHALREPRPEGQSPTATYRTVMVGLADESLTLARAFVGSVLPGPAEGASGGYLLCNVGAAWDHEDLDVWAIARDPADVPAVSALCGRLAQQSLRYALRVQFYLSELLPNRAFAGTLSDYRALLDRDLKSYVAVSQVLQATPLGGDVSLYEEVTAEVHARYFASEPPTASHEGFLRGALTEIESLTELPGRVGLLDPKAEIYRLCRLLFNCGAGRFSLPDTSPWMLGDALARHDPGRAIHYEAVGCAFDFAEVVRYLFALFHAQETPIAYRQAGPRAALDEVARAMGYAACGDPAEALLRDYRAHTSALRAAAKTLGGDLGNYVRSMSVLHRFLARSTRRRPFDRASGNVAGILLHYARTHRRRVFWEDIVDICREHPQALSRWARDVAVLHGEPLASTVGRYALFMQEDVARFVEFLLLLQGGQPSHRAIAELLFDEALRIYADDEAVLSRFTELFHTFPQLVARFVERQAPAATARLIALFRQKWSWRRYRKAGVRLLSLLNLYHFSSNYSRRHSARVLARYPSAITLLDDFDELERIAASALHDALAQRSHVARRQRLGDFYDLEFCRLSLMTLSGVDAVRVGREFRRSSERYVAALFESCVEEIAYATGRPMPRDHDGFALFATGGNAREDPYDVDYDMFAVLADAEPERRRFYNRVLARLTRALTERGIVPHNRLTDRFGAYVVTVDELRAFIARGDEDAFIEQTELLGSRVVAGDMRLDELLTRTIVVPHVFGDASYPLAILGEIRSRRGARDAGELEVKEAPGGLRDAQLFLAVLKHQVGERGPESALLYGRLRTALPALSPALRELERTVAFLKRVRDVYRLTVVSEDALDPAYFAIVALFLGYETGRVESVDDALLREYRRALASVRDTLRLCTRALGLPDEGM